MAATGGSVAQEAAGAARVVDGDSLVVAGRLIDLAAIDAPEAGQRCARDSHIIDCGTVARSQLMDLTAGTHVVCRPNGWCASDGWDLSENMLYTGWAVADEGATDVMLRRQADARDKKRGLWAYEFVSPRDWRDGMRLDGE